jgi:hypothetical protein
MEAAAASQHRACCRRTGRASHIDADILEHGADKLADRLFTIDDEGVVATPPLLAGRPVSIGATHACALSAIDDASICAALINAMVCTAFSPAVAQLDLKVPSSAMLRFRWRTGGSRQRATTLR